MKKPFKEKYKEFEISIVITAIKKTGVRQVVTRLDGTSFEKARTILGVFESFLPKDQRFKK